ncbi:DUF2850 domain-containing protein [Vibrio metschnikovii]
MDRAECRAVCRAKNLCQADAIMIDGRMVTTHYDFNGRHLSFYIGDQKMEYRMLNDEYTEMRPESPKRIITRRFNCQESIKKTFVNNSAIALHCGVCHAF